MSSSVGMMAFPTEWNNQNVPNNQPVYIGLYMYIYRNHRVIGLKKHQPVDLLIEEWWDLFQVRSLWQVAEAGCCQGWHPEKAGIQPRPRPIHRSMD